MRRRTRAGALALAAVVLLSLAPAVASVEGTPPPAATLQAGVGIVDGWGEINGASYSVGPLPPNSA